MTKLSAVAVCVCALTRAAFAQSPADALRAEFSAVNKKVLDMAKDFPADKYDYRLKPEMRSFGEVIVHVSSGIAYAAKAGRGEKANWDEIDPKSYKTKAAIVALMQKAVTDSEAALKSWPPDAFTKKIDPWLSVTEHTAEHYGLLVAYFRANGIVPPESRKK